MFDAALLLGVCDKIVPGLLIGALSFGHLPAIFVPGRADAVRPVRTTKRPRVRQLYAEGKVGREELLEAESRVLPRARHLHLLRHRQLQPDADGDHGPAPAGRSFVNPNTPLRDALTREAAAAVARDHGARQRLHADRRVVDERAIVNGMVGLHATGGSTNHTLHLVAMARAAGHPAHLGRLRRTLAASCRCWRASIRTAPPT